MPLNSIINYIYNYCLVDIWMLLLGGWVLMFLFHQMTSAVDISRDKLHTINNRTETAITVQNPIIPIGSEVPNNNKKRDGYILKCESIRKNEQ